MEWIAGWSVWISFIGGIVVLVGAVGAWYQQNRDQVLTLNTIIGGKSYCLAHPGPPDDPKGMVLTLKHEGEFPLYDLVAYIVDHGEVQVRGDGEPAAATEPIKFEDAPRFQVGTLAVRTHAILDRSLPAATGQRRSVTIRFSARNGVWTQFLHLPRVEGGKWSVTMLPFRDAEPMKPLSYEIPAFRGKAP